MNEIIKYMFIIQSRHPELRVGQIMSIAAQKGGWNNNDIFYCSNDILKAGFRKWLSELFKNNTEKHLTNHP